jgi:hypothetical protein
MTRSADEKRKRSVSLRAAMRRSAESRRCKACGRLSATTRHVLEPGVSVRRCRFCGHETTTDVREMIR